MTNYKKGDIIKCCVTAIEKYGAFVSLDEYYSGLIHISEISDGFVSNINRFMNVGDTIYAKILDVNDENLQLKLSIKGIDFKENRQINIVKEGKNGFLPLKQMLPIWIENKINEIDNAKK